MNTELGLLRMLRLAATEFAVLNIPSLNLQP